MSKRLFLIGFLALSFVVSLTMTIRYLHSDDYVRNRTVRLESPEGSCTGTMVYSPINNKPYILTAAHCEGLAFNNAILAETELGEQAFLPILKIDRDDDLMVLSTAWNRGLYLNQNITFHQSVRAIGWGMGERPFVSRGEILRVAMLFRGDQYGLLTQHVLTDVFLRPGNSGGPLVDDSNNLVGIDVVDYNGSLFSGEVAPNMIFEFFKDVP